MLRNSKRKSKCKLSNEVSERKLTISGRIFLSNGPHGDTNLLGCELEICFFYFFLPLGPDIQRSYTRINGFVWNTGVK